jgi:N-acetylneuraminic acid mutarotase
MAIKAIPFRLLQCCVAGLAAFAFSTAASAQTTTFTYQGRLNSGGAPVSGTYDFQFRIHTALSGGSVVAGPLNPGPVAVSNGVFTVALDAGGSVFDGNARWLEIAVRTNGSASAHNVLSPRQQITSVPYAMYALTPAGPQGATGPVGPAGPPGTTDAGGITSGTLLDSVLSSNIGRISDLTTLSNSLVAQIQGGSTGANLPSGMTVASILPDDTTLIGQGYQRITTLAAADWKNGGSEGEPSARYHHSAIWTENSMVVWGGNNGAGSFADSGGIYQPNTDQWTPVSTIDSPTARGSHTAVWTGQEMIVWGGFGNSGYLNTGGRFNPTNQIWQSASTVNAPSERQGHVAVWTGTRMLVWGGQNQTGLLADGGLYDPANDTWTTLSTSGAPTARKGASAIWLDEILIIWGGEGTAGELNTGGRLFFDAQITPLIWLSTTVSGAPGPRVGQSVVWSGARMIVWGGSKSGSLLNDGSVYDPSGDTWTALPLANAPAARDGQHAVWTGTEMLIWGGQSANASLASGAAYNLGQGDWRPLGSGGNPVARHGGSSVWSGDELLVFGGRSNNTPSAALQRLNPQPTWYLYRRP